MSRTAVEIQVANELFLTLTPRERKRAIAREVLSMLDMEKLTPFCGVYIEYENTELLHSVEDVVTYGGVCIACGVGAATIAACRLFNQANTVGPYGDQIKTYLTKFFDGEEIAQIENAFERTTFYGEMPGEERKRAADLTEGMDQEEAMRAIFKHIAVHGEFRP